MSPLLVIAIPLALVIIGMILNNGGRTFDQPESSPEQDPVKRLEAERQTYRRFFDLQRTRFLKRQKRVGQYAWLVLVVFAVSLGWMYSNAVKRTKASSQIAAIRTLQAEEGKELILSVTLRDGDNVKYLVKSEKAAASGDNTNGFSKESVSAWEVSTLRTAVNVGDGLLPLGVTLKIPN